MIASDISLFIFRKCVMLPLDEYRYGLQCFFLKCKLIQINNKLGFILSMED